MRLTIHNVRELHASLYVSQAADSVSIDLTMSDLEGRGDGVELFTASTDPALVAAMVDTLIQELHGIRLDELRRAAAQHPPQQLTPDAVAAPITDEPSRPLERGQTYSAGPAVVPLDAEGPAPPSRPLDGTPPDFPF